MRAARFCVRGVCLGAALLLVLWRCGAAEPLEELREAYAGRVLDFANERQIEDLEGLLRALGGLAEGEDPAQAARARLARHVCATEMLTYCGGFTPMPPLGLMPADTREALESPEGRSSEEAVEAIVSLLARQSALALTTLREMGVELPTDAEPSLVHEKPEEVGRHLRLVRSLAREACGAWAERVSQIPEDQLGEFLPEKAPLVAYLNALSKPEAGSAETHAQRLKATANVLAQHGASRWADDAEAVFLMEVPQAIGAAARAGAEAPGVAETLEAVLAVLEVRVDLAPAVQRAWHERCETFGERHPDSPWAESLAVGVAAADRQARGMRGPALPPMAPE